MRTHRLPGLLLLCVSTLLMAEDFLSVAPPKRQGPVTPSVKAQATADFEAAAKVAGGKADLWVAPFLIADRAARTVSVWGQAAGVESGAEVEFFVISEASGHDYEALMVSFALPSDVHQALAWIGLKPGWPVDVNAHRFWPRGDRVSASFELKLPGEAETRTMAAESFLVRPNGVEFPKTPWVFVGAPRLPDPNQSNLVVYAADVFSPNSIASAFNLRNTVLDLPFQGSKSASYGNYLRNPGLPLPEGHPLRIVLRPAAAGTYAPEVELTHDASVALPALAGQPKLRERLGEFWNAPTNAIWNLTLNLPKQLSLADCVARAAEFRDLENALPDLRVGPPPAGQLYYQAFLPSPAFRDRTQRPSQPLELHLVKEADQPARAYLLELEEIWGDSREPTIAERRSDHADPDAWVAHFGKLVEPPTVLFLYAPATLSHGEILAWLAPLLDRLPVVYVFTEGP